MLDSTRAKILNRRRAQHLVEISDHGAVQAKGRGELFADYRLRVAGVIRDYGMTERAQAPEDALAL